MWPARDGTELVSFGDSESIVSRWRLDGSGPITRTMAPDWNVEGYSPDGSLLLVGHSDVLGINQSAGDFVYKVIDARSGDDVAMLDGLIGPVWIDSDTLAGLAITDAGLQVARYELVTHELIADGAVLDVGPTTVDATPGKERVLLSFLDDAEQSGDLVQFAPTLQPVGPTIHVDDYVWMAISRTGRRIAVGTNTGIVVFDGDTGERVGQIEGRLQRGATITVADQLFVSSFGGDLIQYDLDTLQPIRTFGGSRGFIQEVNGTSDGSLIAIRGGDRFVSIFDVATGVRIGTPITIPDDQQFFTSLTLDGRSLAIGGGAGTAITVWDLDPERWVEAACRVAGRNLTQEEWDSNIGDLAEYRTTCEGV